MDTEQNKSSVLRNIPAVDALLRSETALGLLESVGAVHLTKVARNVTETLRSELRENLKSGGEFDGASVLPESLFSEAESRLEKALNTERLSGVRRVINATGVIIHTNLGRAPLPDSARHAFEAASGYCNLEYSVDTGKRGRRGARAERLLAEITGAESGLIVNNCAAACVLVLTSLAKGGESIISRGELVEIGGDFRVPDVMSASGTKLIEVGTTNKTKAVDYENAIGENTRLITRVHPSNYRIVGFTAKPTIAELAEIAHRNDLLLYEDAGSGAIVDMSGYGMSDEPVIGDSVKAGADVVTFSGDKLIGGIQAGLIVGRKEVISVIRKNPLYRALRVSKLVYSILESTFESFRHGRMFEEIPVLKMLSATEDDLKVRTEGFAVRIRERLTGDTLSFEVKAGRSVVGGGSAPAVQPKTSLLAVHHSKFSAADIENKLRNSDPPVVCRVFEDRVALDLRTVDPAEEEILIETIASIE